MVVKNHSLPYYLTSSFDPVADLYRNLTEWKDKQPSAIKRFLGHNAVVCIALPIFSTLSAAYQTVLGIGKTAIVAIETPVVVLSANYIPYFAPEDISMVEASNHLRNALTSVVNTIIHPVFHHSLTQDIADSEGLTILFSKIEKLNDSKVPSNTKRVACMAITSFAVPAIALLGAALQPFLIAIGLGIYTLALPVTMTRPRPKSWMFEPQYCALRLRLMVKLVMTAIATPILGLGGVKKSLEFNQKLGLYSPPQKEMKEIVTTAAQKIFKVATIGSVAVAVSSLVYIAAPLYINLLSSTQDSLASKITASSALLGLTAAGISLIQEIFSLTTQPSPKAEKTKKDFKALVGDFAQKSLKVTMIGALMLATASFTYEEAPYVLNEILLSKTTSLAKKVWVSSSIMGWMGSFAFVYVLKNELNNIAISKA